MRIIACSIVLVFGLLLQVGCSGPQCTDGKAGCTCDDKTPCASGLTCQAGTCKAPGTESGAEQPAPDGSKTDGGNGSDTPATEGSADTGPVDTNRCDAGTLGCRCTGLGECNAGLRCDNNVCQQCPEGTAGCACKDGKTCNSGMSCQEGVCKGCVGKANCPCHGNGNCESGNKCVFESSGASTCKACKSGEEDCNCEKDTDCGGSMICVNKRCMDAAKANSIPKSPKCYSVCESDIKMPDGTIRVCHPEHKLVEGCPVGQSCNEGSCLSKAQLDSNDGKSYPFCANDSNCPTWQACVQGRCYSTCRSTSQCKSGFKCHSYVCRRECDVRTNQCGNDTTCTTKGTDSGICMPKANNYNPNTPPKTTAGSFKVAYRNLDMNKIDTAQNFAISNDTKFPVDFTVKRLSDTIGSKTPLAWLKIDVCKTYSDDGASCKAFEGRPSSKEPFTIEKVPAGKTIILRVSNGAGKPQNSTAYQGQLQITAPQMSPQELNITYKENAQGRWKGTMVAFGNFDDTNIEKFPASTSLDLRTLKNAFLRRWLNFKRNEITRDQFFAMLSSIREGSWQLKKVADDCRKAYSTEGSDDIVCYPYSSPKGYEILAYSQREAPPPSGGSELPFAINIKQTSDTALEGRIDTSATLQYSGNPQIKLELDSALGTKTLVPLKSFNATIDIGGRFYVGKDESCPDPNNFQKATIPWLLPDFKLMSYDRTGSLFRDRFACRSKTIPRNTPSNATDAQKAAILAYNMSLSSSNPVPNGWRLRRQLELVDGAVIEGRYMFVIYKERFVSFFASEAAASGPLSGDFANYGYMLLRREQADLTPDSYVGSVSPKLTSCSSDSSCTGGQKCQAGACRNPNRLQQVTCDPSVVREAMNANITSMNSLNSWSSTSLKNLVNTLMGQQPDTVTDNTALQIKGADNNGITEYTYNRDNKKYYIHYYCEDTNQFNGGPKGSRKDCPAGSKLIFFEHTTTETDMRAHPCQTAQDDAQKCNNRLTQLRTSTDYRENVPYRCADKNAVFCEANRKDMREGKIFFKPATQNTFVSPMSSLRNALFEAFRYRIKFRSRTGKNVGFTPEICSKVLGSQIPYCYDPEVIEKIELRVNCLEAIFTNKTISSKLDANTRATIKDFLSHAFSYSNRNINGVIFTDPGFETLNAELKVMLGDEAYTRSFASRYDLANTNLVSFQGSLHEPNGIDLSGALGYEMYNLYLSTQYYQMVLDRFFSQGNVIYQSFKSNSTTFITAASVTSYFQKLLLASTRKARSWSQVAKRYHELNRADLAQHVIERSYAATFMEMTILTRLLRSLILVVDSKEIDQIRAEIDKVALTYKSALLDMQETYAKLSMSISYFGIAAGYMPFPALDRFSATTQGANAFTVSLAYVKEKLATAQQKEEGALQTKRSFDTDAARFQSELVQIQQNYEGQLAGICGNIEVTDSGGQTRLYPAIARYAPLSPKTRNMGNPCGQLQGGSLFNALVEIEKMRVSIMALKHQKNTLKTQIKLEEKRIKAYCNAKFNLANITWAYRTRIDNLQLEIEDTDRQVDEVVRKAMIASNAAEQIKCSIILGDGFGGGDCFTAPIAIAGVITAGYFQEREVGKYEKKLAEKRAEQEELERQLEKTQLQFECRPCAATSKCDQQGTAQLESQVRIKEYTSQISMLNYEAIKAQYDLELAMSNIARLRQQARRLMTQLEETIQLTINVQAAQNDPNVRIYKNDAIISAERTFEDAMREAYRATLIYEYYTGTSYARKGDLYLIRMISYGDKNLETYVSQLEQAFRDFEEDAGKPDIRVLVLSARDDLLKISRTKEDGTPRDLNDRVAEFQKALADPGKLNANGYTTIPFSISVTPNHSMVSPITYNHKILYVMGEINSTSKGDDVARLYLRQSGTSVVRLKQTDDYKYYALPQRTAVINPYFNGSKVFTPEVYQNFRLRDRPLGNTRWELMFNQVDEKANQDIDLNSISDIVLYIYYTDFTKEN